MEAKTYGLERPYHTGDAGFWDAGCTLFKKMMLLFFYVVGARVDCVLSVSL
jgi:hypothetical protein